MMDFFRMAACLTLLFFSAQGAAQSTTATSGKPALQIPPADVGRTAVRCGVLYLFMSDLPRFSDKKDFYLTLVDDMDEVAQSSGATDSDAEKWADEFMTELEESAKAGSLEVFKNQAAICLSFPE